MYIRGISPEKSSSIVYTSLLFAIGIIGRGVEGNHNFCSFRKVNHN